nr:flagellin [uncultured Gellertiella sp.]
MTSILTNSAALAALGTLRMIDSNMDMVQRRISSGYKVGSASDNSAYWSIATTMRSDSAALSTTQDALGLAAAKADTSYAGLSSAIDILTQVKAELVAAREPGVDKDKINKEVAELKNQLVSVAQSASFSGENWLYNTSTAAIGTKQLVSSFSRAADGTVSVETINLDTSGTVLIDRSQANRGVLTATTTVTLPNSSTTASYYLLNVSSTTAATGTEVQLSTSTTNSDIDGMLSAVESILKTVTDSAATVGTTKTRIDMQSMFVKNLVDVIDKGVGRLVDADMNAESTRLKALQTQQQLGIQSLSIANTNAANIMQLFRQ